MKSPASPALGLAVTSSTKAPTVPAKPASNSVHWPKRSAPVPATRTFNAPALSSTSLPASYSSMPGSTSEQPAGNKVYQSLQRPHLLWGGERELSLINAMLVTVFTTFGLVGFNLRLLAYAAFFAFPVQWLIRMLSQADPDYLKNYF